MHLLLRRQSCYRGRRSETKTSLSSSPWQLRSCLRLCSRACFAFLTHLWGECVCALGAFAELWLDFAIRAELNLRREPKNRKEVVG